jgi:hypothetical protein
MTGSGKYILFTIALFDIRFNRKKGGGKCLSKTVGK